MSNSTTDVRIILINNISLQLNHYITLFVFLFGTVGNVLNIIVLSQPLLRRTPCAVYFLGSSVASLGIIIIGLPSRMIAGKISDLTNTSSYLCKSRIFLLYSFRTTSAWLLVFATIDRWCSSSTEIHRRRLSSHKTAGSNIIIIFAVSFVLWIESMFCYDADVEQAPIKCYGKSNSCRIYNDVAYASSTIAIPSVFMLIFGLLTIRNISRSRRASRAFFNTDLNLARANRRKRKSTRRTEVSLTCMLLLQVVLLTLCSVPQAMHQFYLTFTIDVSKSPLRVAIENFIVNFNFSLTYIGNAIPFYIYTLNSTVFRQTLIRLVHSTIQQLKFYLTFRFWNT
ncbi:unnamed protein product [Rotaria socialis]|uniref:G-protein coupled receptors family 1 profile domain-containing protein n=1 Tax=Rotaria socialis TaxID=392032 RepID=A0A818M0N6_9BILA|nr:unnamed protein product [Rotaria socialis]CAF4209621.1 unnamed protein product [Rotaria socialis]